MYRPSTRLLTILELLQTHASLTGEELARRLEVEPRTVRRYVVMLQDMGMPIETTRGPGGGYHLRPGFKLPPLLFTEEEATAILLGLLGTSWLELDVPSMAVEGALAKVMRVLPDSAHKRLKSVSTHLILSPHEQEMRPEASMLIDLSTAIQAPRRVAFAYCSHHGNATERTVDPYGLAGWWGRWYLAAYCNLRLDYRLFRLDRITKLEVLAEHFERDEAFDGEAFLAEHLMAEGNSVPIAVEFRAPLQIVKQKVPSSFGTLTPTASGVLFELHYGNLDDIARYLVGLNLPFIVYQPAELHEALMRLAEQITQYAQPPRFSGDQQQAELGMWFVTTGERCATNCEREYLTKIKQRWIHSRRCAGCARQPAAPGYGQHQ